MKIIEFKIILVLFLIFSSFNKTEFINSKYLFQKWVCESYENGNIIYKSKRRLNRNKPGIEFKENGTIELNTSASWCGTELELKFVDGTWRNLSESLLLVEYENWNGLNKDTLRIIELTKSKLVLKPMFNNK